MRIFADTSALFAVLDAENEDHDATTAFWDEAMAAKRKLATTNYVVVETCALLAKRLGMNAVRRFIDEAIPVLLITWVDENLHDAGVTATLASGRNGPSLVDCVSFATMRRNHITEVFAVDKHFRAQGFVCRP